MLQMDKDQKHSEHKLNSPNSPDLNFFEPVLYLMKSKLRLQPSSNCRRLQNLAKQSSFVMDPIFTGSEVSESVKMDRTSLSLC